MDRRELLRMIALVTGSAVIGGEVFLTGCNSGAETDTKTEPKTDTNTVAKPAVAFTLADISLLNEIGETILPATSSPGAKAAQVGQFMKLYVTDCYTQDAQSVFTKGINDLQDACEKMHGKTFMDCSDEQRKQLLLKLEDESQSYNKIRDDQEKPLRDAAKKENKENEFVPSPQHYYTMMKQLTLLGFFTSKPGVTEAMRYVPVPQRYDGALPYKKGDKAFS